MELQLPTLEHQRKAYKRLAKRFLSQTSFNAGYQACREFFKKQLAPAQPSKTKRIFTKLTTPLG